MSFLSFIPIIGQIIEKIIPGDSDKQKAIKLQMENEIIKSLAEVNKGQLEINKEEAKDPNLFKSGWRPAIAWMCVFGFGYTVFKPLIDYSLIKSGQEPLPHFDSTELYTILMALLGMGGYRTYEKFKGITR